MEKGVKAVCWVKDGFVQKICLLFLVKWQVKLKARYVDNVDWMLCLVCLKSCFERYCKHLLSSICAPPMYSRRRRL